MIDGFNFDSLSVNIDFSRSAFYTLPNCNANA